MMKKKLKISILFIALLALPLVLGGCSFDELFNGCGGTEYSITYVLNADDALFAPGENNPQTYNSSASKYLYSPVRENHIFLGWYTDSDFSGWAWSNIPKGTRGDLTLYAKWGLEGEAVYWEGFLRYKTKFDEAKRGTTLTINSREELSAYLEYIQYYYIPDDVNGVRIRLNYSNYGVQREISSAHDSLPYSSYLGLSYSGSTSTPNVGILYDNLIEGEASRQAATRNYYTQIYPYEYATNGAPHEFAIDGALIGLECSTSNQLFYAAQVGARPEPEAGSAAERIYGEARAAVAEAVNEDMTEAEKVTAIYDWLIMNVTYDYDVLKYTDNVAVAAEYDAFYLEGVFGTGRAVCDGISKAMTLMCRIEGIPCVRVVGDGHAWNKVFVNGRWYIADATFGDTSITMNRTNYSFMTHRYLLASENANEKYKLGVNYTDENYTASVDYGYYHEKTFEYGGETYDFIIESREEYNVMYNWAKGLGYRYPYSVDFYIDNARWITASNYTQGENYITVFFNM